MNIHTSGQCLPSGRSAAYPFPSQAEPPVNGADSSRRATDRSRDRDLSQLSSAHHVATSRDCQTGYGPYCDSPPSSPSEGSLDNNIPHQTPPVTPGNRSPNGTGYPAEQIGRLSIEHGQTAERSSPPLRGRGMLGASSAVTSKRSASSELPCPVARQSPCRYGGPNHPPVSRSPKGRTSRRPQQFRPQHTRLGSHDHARPGVIDSDGHFVPKLDGHASVKAPVPRDSGYESKFPSRNNTQIRSDTLNSSVKTTSVKQMSQSTLESEPENISSRRKGLIQLPANSRYPGLILQPDSSPISQDQLAAEVKGIYAGLVMVEAKCINIDAIQAGDPKSQLGPEQWQALIALHRTLLYEHHDFLMATQHPSATQALRGLASKYSMPARMWKHGIHAFLEVLRHRRPESQDYMLAFIYLAYQMMALLFETVPSFTDTWIECLGDLARYRMAIEEEKEAHATWGGVAARWYTMASDRHPAIGRLYHHLGILERPSLRKYCYYAKSLTCVIPFQNARDSLSTLCGPIVQDKQTIESSRQSAEARIVTFHALAYTQREITLVNEVGKDSLQLLGQQPAKLRDFGAYLAVTNVAALFELGSPTNTLWQCCNAAVNQSIQSSRPSMTASNQIQDTALATILPDTDPKPTLASTTSFFVDCFDFVLQQYNSPEALRDCLPYIHVTLVWLHSLHSLRLRLADNNTYDAPFNLGRLSWIALAALLNTLAQLDPISAHILECARQGIFPTSEDARPLSEDYVIRGLVWGQWYFSPGWFDGQCEDDGRAIETPSMAKARGERVCWLGLFLAFHTEYLTYDTQRKVFSATSAVQAAMSVASSAHPAVVGTGDVDLEQASEVVAVSPRSRSSATNSSGSSRSEDGFHIVKSKKAKRNGNKPRSYADAAAQQVTPKMRVKNMRDNNDDFDVADENGMVWSANGC